METQDVLLVGISISKAALRVALANILLTDRYPPAGKLLFGQWQVMIRITKPLAPTSRVPGTSWWLVNALHQYETLLNDRTNLVFATGIELAGYQLALVAGRHARAVRPVLLVIDVGQWPVVHPTTRSLAPATKWPGSEKKDER